MHTLTLCIASSPTPSRNAVYRFYGAQPYTRNAVYRFYGAYLSALTLRIAHMAPNSEP